MGRVEVSAYASFPPERFVPALTDFGPGRAKIWGNSSPGSFEVHEVKMLQAEVPLHYLLNFRRRKFVHAVGMGVATPGAGAGNTTWTDSRSER